MSLVMPTLHPLVPSAASARPVAARQGSTPVALSSGDAAAERNGLATLSRPCAVTPGGSMAYRRRVRLLSDVQGASVVARPTRAGGTLAGERPRPCRPLSDIAVSSGSRPGGAPDSAPYADLSTTSARLMTPFDQMIVGQ